MNSQDAAGHVVAAHLDRMRGFFFRKGYRDDELDDIVQEACVAVLSGYPRFRGASAVGTWVYAVCRNVQLAAWRRVAASRRTVLLPEDAVPDNRYGPPSDLALLIEKLPPLDRTVYRLYYVENRRVAEIGVIMGLPEGTVKYRLYELRRALRGLLAE
ncbi:MAG: sigma-70 family RNA polymerase sigma factor [Spirochaetaceae bacterium]|nr:MAG: sigma-70 family RNA polymerase sigma factor [Spirochaetaceae bacterium]